MVGLISKPPGVDDIILVFAHYIIITMVRGKCQWSDLPLIKRMMTGCRSLFPTMRFAFTTIPTYSNGQIGMVLASLNTVRVTG